MTATFHPGVTNCGGAMAASGCSCARSMSAEVLDVDLPGSEGASFEEPMTYDERTVREWMTTASDTTFARLCSETSTWVAVTADRMSEGPSHEPDWYAIRNSHVAGCLARIPHRDLPKVLLDEIRNRQITDIGPGAAERARTYETVARAFFTHVPDRLGSPTTANEARGMWKGVQIGTSQDGRGFSRPLFVTQDQPGDALSDPVAVRFAVEDTECGTLAVEALRNGYGTRSLRSEQFILHLAASGNREVRDQVANAVSYRDELLPVMAADEAPQVRATIAGRMSHLKTTLERETKVRSHHGRYEVDYSQLTRSYRDRLAEVSRNLARDPDTDVRRALATSTTWADEKTPRTLAKDPDPMVRNVLAFNARKSRLDEKTVKTLAKDPEPGIRETLLTSGVDIPERYLKRLLKDRNPAVAAAAVARVRPRNQNGAPTLSIKDGRIHQGS